MVKWISAVLPLLLLTASCAPAARPELAPHAPIRAATRPPTVNPAWAVPTVVLDPANVTGLAKIDGSGLDATHPVTRWDEVNDGRWGCYGSPNNCPRLTGPLTVRFMSTEQSTDTFRFHPSMETASNVIIQCDLPAATGTGTLGGVTITTRANNAPPLKATLTPAGGAIAVGQMIIDTTANAVFWVSKSDGANVWELSQPYAPANLATHVPTAQVTVANGDSYSTYVPLTINLETVLPSGYQTNNSIIIDRCTLGISTTMTTGANVDVEECSVPSYWRAIGPIVNAVPYVFNSSLGNAGFVQAGGTNQFGATGYQIIGGQEEPCGGYIIGDLVVDGDFVSNTNLVIGAGSIGTVYEDNCPALHITGVVQVTQSLYNGGVPVIYGPGLVAVYGGGHLYYPTGANKAATTFPIAQGINLDLNSHQLAADTTGDPVVWHLRTDNGHTFVLNLDKTIAAGGYGGGTSIMCAQGQGNFVCNIAP